MIKFPKRVIAIICLSSSLLWLAGCTRTEEGFEKRKIILTNGFDDQEVFRIEKISCYLPEIMIYLTTTQNQYEDVFGKEIWETEIEGVSLEANIKETVLARIAQIKTMNLLAQKKEVELTKEENENVIQAAEEFYATLNQTEISQLDIDIECIKSMYSEYAIANKVYYDIIKDINPEISDDEARTITVQYIYQKTYSLNAQGERVSYSESNKLSTLQQMQNVLRRAQEGEDFESLMVEHSEDTVMLYSFGKGETELPFEEEAFSLANGEISDIIETSTGYYIIKCINTFNKAETDQNKIEIVEERKNEVFNEEYNLFVSKLSKLMNHNLWNKVTLLQMEEIQTKDFFHIYKKYFGTSL